MWHWSTSLRFAQSRHLLILQRFSWAKSEPMVFAMNTAFVSFFSTKMFAYARPASTSSWKCSMFRLPGWYILRSFAWLSWLRLPPGDGMKFAGRAPKSFENEEKKNHQNWHRPQIAFPKKQSAFFFDMHKAAAFICEFASVHLPLVPQAANSWRAISYIGDKVAAAAKSSSKEKPGRKIRKGKGKSWRKTSWETRRQHQERTAKTGDHEERQAWETRRERQAKGAQKENHEGRQAWEDSPKGKSWTETSLGQGGSGSQEQPRREIAKEDKLGRQGGSGSQEQARREIVNGDKLGRQGGSSSQEQNGDHEWRQAWGTRRQRQPRVEIRKGDKLGRQGGSGRQEWRSWRETGLGDKAAAASRPFGVFQSLRSRTPYSFQPSGENHPTSNRTVPYNPCNIQIDIYIYILWWNSLELDLILQNSRSPPCSNRLCFRVTCCAGAWEPLRILRSRSLDRSKNHLTHRC